MFQHNKWLIYFSIVALFILVVRLQFHQLGLSTIVILVVVQLQRP